MATFGGLGLFRVFQTVFRIDLKVFRGQFRSADMPPYRLSEFIAEIIRK